MRAVAAVAAVAVAGLVEVALGFVDQTGSWCRCRRRRLRHPHHRVASYLIGSSTGTACAAIAVTSLIERSKGVVADLGIVADTASSASSASSASRTRGCSAAINASAASAACATAAAVPVAALVGDPNRRVIELIVGARATNATRAASTTVSSFAAVSTIGRGVAAIPAISASAAGATTAAVAVSSLVEAAKGEIADLDVVASTAGAACPAVARISASASRPDYPRRSELQAVPVHPPLAVRHCHQRRLRHRRHLLRRGRRSFGSGSRLQCCLPGSCCRCQRSRQRRRPHHLRLHRYGGFGSRLECR